MSKKAITAKDLPSLKTEEKQELMLQLLDQQNFLSPEKTQTVKSYLLKQFRHNRESVSVSKTEEEGKFRIDGLGDEVDFLEKDVVLANLSNNFGTISGSLINTFVTQLINLHGGIGTDEDYVNGALAFLQEMKPKNPLETMLLTQMYGTHTLSCAELARANQKEQTFEVETESINRSTKLSRTFISQMETLKKYRGDANQKITVEHVNINDGGKAVIGTIDNHVTGVGKNEKQ